MENGLGYPICPARQRFTVFEIDEDARELRRRWLNDLLLNKWTPLRQQHHQQLSTSIRNTTYLQPYS
jgi:hypothetical protein